MTRVLVCCGVGGVGKTTIAAALGVGLAKSGEKVVVLTIDPAQRLADALGLEKLGNTPAKVPLEGGELDAMMLDRKATWDEVIRRFSSDEAKAERLLNNRYYKAVSERLTGSHEYMAIEKLYELVETQRWDVVVVDTPPTQHVLDFFKAPDRIRRIFDRTSLAAFIEPGQGVLSVARSGASRLFRRLAGERVIEDISDFFRLFADLSAGFRARSKKVRNLLRSQHTVFYLVAAANAPERSDIIGFLDTLKTRQMQFGGFFVNRVAKPPAFEQSLAPEHLPPAPDGVDVSAWAANQRALLELARHLQGVAHRHRTQAQSLSAAAGNAPVWLIHDQAQGIQTIEGLAVLAESLPPAAEPIV